MIWLLYGVYIFFKTLCLDIPCAKVCLPLKIMIMKTYMIALLLIILFFGKSQHTFSIVAVDSITGEVGSAGATCADSIIWYGTTGAIKDTSLKKCPEGFYFLAPFEGDNLIITKYTIVQNNI